MTLRAEDPASIIVFALLGAVAVVAAQRGKHAAGDGAAAALGAVALVTLGAAEAATSGVLGIGALAASLGLLARRIADPTVRFLVRAGLATLLVATALISATVLTRSDDASPQALRAWALIASALAIHLAVAAVRAGSSASLDERGARFAGAAVVGIGLLVLLGWIQGNASIVQLGTQAVPMQFNTALSLALVGAALALAPQVRARVVVALLAVPVGLSIGTLLEQFGGVDLGIDQLFWRHGVTGDAVAPGRMAPNTAIAMLFAGLAVGLRAALPARQSSQAAVWTLGLFVFAIAMLAIAGFAIDERSLRALGSYSPMALFTAIALGVLGLGLTLLRGERGDAGQVQRPAWFPALVALSAIGVSVAVWHGLRTQQVENLQRSTEAAAEAVTSGVESFLPVRLGAVERMASVLHAMPPEVRTQLFDVDTRLRLQGVPGVQFAAMLDRDGHVLRSAAVRGANVPPANAWPREARVAIESARAQRRTLISAPHPLSPGVTGFVIATPAPPDGEIEFLLVIGAGFDELFRALLGTTALGYAVEIRDGDHVILARGLDAAALDQASASAAAEVYGRRFEVRTWPTRDSGTRAGDRLANVTLVAGLVMAVLLAVALRLVGLTRERGAQLARANADLGARTLQARALADAALLATRQADDPALCQLLVDRLREVIGAHQAVMSLNLSGSWAQSINAVSFSDRYARWRDYAALPDGSGIYALVCETNQPLRMTQAQMEAHPRWRAFGAQREAHPPMRGWLAAPLIDDAGRNIGLIQLSDKFAGEFDAHDEAVTQQFAQIAATVIQRARLNQRLRDNEARLLRAQQTARIGDWEYDQATGRMSWSPEVYRICGVAPTATATFDLIMSRVTPHEKARIADVLAGIAAGEPVDVQHEFVRDDGQVRHLHSIGFPRHDAAGQLIGVHGTVQDVTDRVLAESALRESRDQLERAQQLARMGSFIFDVASGHSNWSRTLYDIFGIAPGTLEPTLQIFLAAVHPDDRARVAEHHERAVARGATSDVTHRIVRRNDGAVRWIRNLAEIERDASGRALRMIGTTHDVTDQMAAEERARAMVDAAPNAMILVDDRACVVQVNPKAVDLFGYVAEEMLGNPVEMLVPEPLRAIHVSHRDAFLRAPRTRVFGADLDLHGQRRDGTRFPIELGLSPVRIGDRQWVLASIVDITERQRAQRERDAAVEDLRLRNRELQDFAFVASHDLQEPLRKIRAFGDRLSTRYADALGAEGGDYIARMGSAAGRMQVLIEDLLSYSRVTTQGQPFAEVALDDVLREVLVDLETTIEGARARVECGHLGALQADRTQMRQLFQNLISNSIKFRAAGRDPLVRISGDVVAGRRPDAPARLRIVVEDNGIGFDDKYRQRIFVPFQRLHGRDEYPGTGIGLAIVRKIVERHDGSVVAHGRPDEGARFVIELPLRRAPERRETT